MDFEQMKNTRLDGDKKYRVVYINTYEDIEPFEVIEYIFGKNKKDVLTRLHNCHRSYYHPLQIEEICEWDEELDEV